MAAATLFAGSPNLALAAHDYHVSFEGAPNSLRAKLELVSSLVSSDKAPPTTAAMHRLARQDVVAIDGALKAAGFYNAKIDYELRRKQEEGHNDVEIAFIILSGPRFKITNYVIAYSDQATGDEALGGRPTSLADLKIKADGSAAGANLQSLQQQFLSALWDNGYPRAKIVARRAEARLEQGEAEAIFTFESGPKAVFGTIMVSKDVRTKDDFLTRLATWKEGEVFEQSKLISYRDKLANTGLFSGIDVAPGSPADGTGATPVILSLSERKRRTIGVGLSYSTTEGPGGRLFFEYRNLFGAGETARAELQASSVEQSLGLDLIKPLPGLPGTLIGEFDLLNETTDAFDARTVSLGAAVSKLWLKDRFETRGGVAFETSRITQDEINERTYFLSLPFSATWNTESDPLFLADGERISLGFTSFNGSDNFIRTELNARSRLSFGDKRFTLAGRTRFGATTGSSLSALPLNQRFYAGGGSSVRGFGFQEAGPIDSDGDPVGGRSVIEVSGEMRAKVTDAIQLAAFTDVGNVSSTILPDLKGDYFIGVGGGVRYFTPIGPLRIDVGIPLDRRETDSSFQLFFSIGQAF